MSLKPAVMRRLMKEITELQATPPEGIRIQTSEDNMLDVVGIIQGPEGTPYANGYFKVKFTFTEEFPAAPPRCRLVTKIFHPNVSTAGEICVNTLKKDWQSSFGIAHILVTVKCLLIYPNPESALDEEAGKLLLENYDDYCSRARLITSVHAKTRPAEFADAQPEASGSKVKAAVPKKAAAPAATMTAPSTVPPILAFAAPSTAPPAVVPSSRSVSTSTSASVLAGGENDGVPTATTSTKNLAKDKVLGKDGKERHASPLPLAPADGNVAQGTGKESPTPTAANTPGAAAAAKAVKRSATGAATGVEKRKKALKRL